MNVFRGIDYLITEIYKYTVNISAWDQIYHK